MSLPKIEYPIFTIEQPSTKEKLKFRPMLVKEEKILLIAKASEEDADIMLAVKQIVNNCCLEKNFKVEEIPLFDLQYLFIQLRANSVSDILELKYIDNEDQKEYDFQINLKEIQVKFPEKNNLTIDINETTGFIMKYPESSLYNDKEFVKMTDENESFLRLVAKSIDKIYDKEKNYDAKDYKEYELVAFIENLDFQTLTKIRDFISSIPHIEHTLKYKNTKGTERIITLRTLNDFFMFR